jgi:hypothetical protein
VLSSPSSRLCLAQYVKLYIRVVELIRSAGLPSPPIRAPFD